MSTLTASAYEISTERVAEIITSDPRLADYTADEVEEFCCADWREGDAHQEWLDTAPAAEIASWAFGGLHEARMERQFEDGQARDGE